jgi:hypothetical protein
MKRALILMDYNSTCQGRINNTEIKILAIDYCQLTISRYSFRLKVIVWHTLDNAGKFDMELWQRLIKALVR